MHLGRAQSLYTTLFSRHISSLPKLSKIPSKYRPQAIQQAQQIITDYLHSTRSLPYTYAEHIGKNSLYSVSNLIAKLEFSAPSFATSLRRFLRYHPINEFEFFLESIGIEHDEISTYLPSNKFFFSEDGSMLNAARVLNSFGFPWNKLGKLYKEEISIFRKSSEDISSRIFGFKNRGFNNIMVIGISLAFPHLLGGDGELSEEIDSLFDDLKRVFVDFDLASCVDSNIDAWYEICRKIRVFYDLGCEKEEIGELMGKSKDLFLKYPEEVLVQKVEYFCRFGVKKENVGLLLLQSPEILSFDLETPVISIMGILKHFGLSDEELKHAAQDYPYVFGRNKIINLPHSMRALNLHQWFFNRIKNGNHKLLVNYVLDDPDEDIDKEFTQSLSEIQSSRIPFYTMNKLNFLHGIGFGHNILTIKVLQHMHGTSSELQDRFDCLLGTGIEFFKLCMIIRLAPKIMNQKPDTLEQKVNFLCQEMDASLEYLNVFPAFLCFDLDYRIKPRYRFHKWLTEKGLSIREYSIASIVATSEKNFVARLHGIHPAAPKHWFECFLYRKPNGSH